MASPHLEKRDYFSKVMSISKMNDRVELRNVYKIISMENFLQVFI